MLVGHAVPCASFGTPVEDFLRQKLSTKHSSRFWPAKGLRMSSVGGLQRCVTAGEVQDCASAAFWGVPQFPGACADDSLGGLLQPDSSFTRGRRHMHILKPKGIQPAHDSSSIRAMLVFTATSASHSTSATH